MSSGTRKEKKNPQTTISSSYCSKLHKQCRGKDDPLETMRLVQPAPSTAACLQGNCCPCPASSHVAWASRGEIGENLEKIGGKKMIRHSLVLNVMVFFYFFHLRSAADTVKWKWNCQSAPQGLSVSCHHRTVRTGGRTRDTTRQTRTLASLWGKWHWRTKPRRHTQKPDNMQMLYLSLSRIFISCCDSWRGSKTRTKKLCYFRSDYATSSCSICTMELVGKGCPKQS